MLKELGLGLEDLLAYLALVVDLNVDVWIPSEAVFGGSVDVKRNEISSWGERKVKVKKKKKKDMGVLIVLFVVC